MFETLNWAVAILDYDKTRYGRRTTDRRFSGLIFARNRVHHQWADALRVTRETVRASSGPLSIEGESIAWWWAPLDELPVGRKDRRAAEYRDTLAGRLAAEVLGALALHLRVEATPSAT